MCINL
jgi:uncharacterized protein GlcG (DUF336 family)